MLPIMCIQPACMNIAVRMVIQCVACDNIGGDLRPLHYKCVATHQFQHEDERVHDDDCGGDDGESVWAVEMRPIMGSCLPCCLPPFLGIPIFSETFDWTCCSFALSHRILLAQSLIQQHALA